MSVQSFVEDVVKGIWSAVCIAGTLTWGYVSKWWKGSKKGDRMVVLTLLAFVLLAMVTCVAKAENDPGSNFGAFADPDSGVVFMCYVTTEEAKVGTIYTCLIHQPSPIGLIATGAVSFCTVTSYKDDMPWVDCGEYDAMKALAGGV